MKVSGGLKEDGIIVGNAYDKYNSGNPIVRWMMQGFAQDLSNLVNLASPTTIHEVGCGEGYWTLKWTQEGMAARGSRSEEHTSELQSLMRISYAVFCLKKKKKPRKSD